MKIDNGQKRTNRMKQQEWYKRHIASDRGDRHMLRAAIPRETSEMLNKAVRITGMTKWELIDKFIKESCRKLFRRSA